MFFKMVLADAVARAEVRLELRAERRRVTAADF
jgi:hypothetical protein